MSEKPKRLRSQEVLPANERTRRFDFRILTSLFMAFLMVLGVSSSLVPPADADTGYANAQGLQLSLEANPNPVVAGAPVTLTYSIYNGSPHNAYWSYGGATFGSISSAIACSTSAAGGWSGSAGNWYIAPGGTAKLSCTVTAKESIQIDATVTGMRYLYYSTWYSYSAFKASESLTVTGVASTIPPVPAGGVRDTGTSADGKLAITKTADKKTVGAGGELVTYTYTMTNKSSSRLYFTNFFDDKCAANMEYDSGMPNSRIIYRSNGTSWYASRAFYLEPGATTYWSCASDITQTTTNVATATFSTVNSSNYVTGNTVASASVTVNVQQPSGAASCSTLWFGSDQDPGFPEDYSNGHVGTIDPITGVETPKVTLPAGYDSTAAVAVDPSKPNLIYYIPRTGYYATDTYGSLMVYDTSLSVSSTNPKLASNANTGSRPTDAVRMATAPDGSVWVIDASGGIYQWTASAGWKSLGAATTSNGYTFAPGNYTLASGDMAFDGLGNMWVIGSSEYTKEAFLYTVSYTDLTNGGGARLELVGDGMGTGWFNGLAFMPDGTLYATSTGTSSASLYTVDMVSGKASFAKTLSYSLADLASCALPKPELDVTKEVSPAGPVSPGDKVTYTIKVTNLGTLSSSNTTLVDKIPAGMTYVGGSARLNGTQVTTTSTFPYEQKRLINSENAKPGIIAPGKTATITFDVTINDVAQTEVCNQGLVSYVGADESGVRSDDPSKPGGTDPTCSPVVKPEIQLDKTGSTEVLTTTPMDVVYTYDVTNPGTEDLKDVKVTDDKCPVGAPNTPLAAVKMEGTEFNIGDLNKDNLLQPTESWQFTCSSTLNAPVKNTAITTGIGVTSGKIVTDTDIWEVKIPTVTIDKKSNGQDGGSSVKPGDIIDYSIVVTNTGTTDQTNVTVSDVLPEGVTYVDGSASKTYMKDSVSGGIVKATLTKDLGPTKLNSSATQSFTVGAADSIPAGATLTGYEVIMNGDAKCYYTMGGTYGWVCTDTSGGYDGYRGNKNHVSVTMTGPGGGTLFSVDRGTDPDTNEFGTTGTGAWNTVTRTGTLTGSPLGTYTLNWYDAFDSSYVDPDHVVTTKVKLTYQYDTTKTGRAPVTDVAHAPSELVTAADNITLKPGESITVTFQGLVGENAPAELTNKATTIQNLTDEVTDKVLKPAFKVNKTVAATGTDQGDKISLGPDGKASVTYNVTVTSTGEREGMHPEIVDTPSIPTGFTIESVTMKGADGKDVPLTATDGKYTLPAGTTNMAPGTSVTYSFTVNYIADVAKIDWQSVGVCETAGGGNPAKGLFNSITMDGDSDGTDNNDACVPVELTEKITLAKIGENCDVNQPICPLAGAEFTLFESDPLAKLADGSDPQPVADAFTPVTNPDAIGGRDATGAVFGSTALQLNKDYWIVESKAPDGFNLLAQPIKFSITLVNGKPTITVADAATHGDLVTVDANNALHLVIRDTTPAPLPVTGGSGPWPYAAAALALAGAAVITLRFSGRTVAPKRAA